MSDKFPKPTTDDGINDSLRSANNNIINDEGHDEWNFHKRIPSFQSNDSSLRPIESEPNVQSNDDQNGESSFMTRQSRQEAVEQTSTKYNSNNDNQITNDKIDDALSVSTARKLQEHECRRPSQDTAQTTVVARKRQIDTEDGIPESYDEDDCSEAVPGAFSFSAQYRYSDYDEWSVANSGETSTRTSARTSSQTSSRTSALTSTRTSSRTSARTSARKSSMFLIRAEQVDEDVLTERYQELAKQKIREKIQAETTTAVTVEISPLPDRSQGRKTYLVGTVVACILILACIAVGVVRIISSSNEQAKQVLRPTERLKNADLDYFIDQILQNSISNQAQFQDETTPQYRAASWLVNDDYLERSIRDSPMSVLVDRYALAVLYYSTNGTQWIHNTGHLTRDPVCSWHGIDCDSTDSVTWLELRLNNLRGTLPAEVAAITSLQYIVLGDNDLHGTLPTILGNLSRLKWLLLYNNQLSGRIPDSLAQLSSLEEFQLSNNRLTGSIPEGIMGLQSLEFLDFRSNEITGTIPTFNEQKSLKIVSLGFNRLNGTVPESIFMLRNLEDLVLADNELTGTISSQIGALKRLEFLWLAENYLNGTIPSTIGNLEFVKSILIPKNNFSGTIPTELGRLSDLEVAYFYDNFFTGTLPSEIGRLDLLRQFFVNNNEVSGAVPSTFSLLSNLEVIGLAQTNLSGSLNPIFCNQSHQVLNIQADCGGPSPEVKCSCCTRCCDGKTVCSNDSNQICHNYARNLEINELQDLAGCTCTSNGSSLSCDLSACPTCNEDSSICGVTTEFGFSFGDSGYPEQWRSTFQYDTGRPPATVTWEYILSDGSCKVSVNGTECNSCVPHLCDDGYRAKFIDCTNIQYDGEGPLEYKSCFPEKGGVLDIFEWIDQGSLTGCPFVPMAFF